MSKMDSFDLRILNLLKSDGRITMAALADRIGLSKSPTQARVKRLERDGVIRGYAALVDHSKTDSGFVTMVQVTLSDTRSKALEAFNEAVLDVPQIVGCHMIAGSFDYLLKVRTRDMTAYRRVMAEILSTLPHVSHTSTFAVMETVRDG